MMAFRQNRKAIGMPVALALLTAVVYWPVTGYEFINLDDWGYILLNPHLQEGLNWKDLMWTFRAGLGGNWHPLTWWSWMLDAQFFGMNPGGFHFTNLLLHIVNTVLLFLFLRRLTGAPGRSSIAAGLFALHPLHVESVAWITERKDVLSTMFWLLTLWAYASYVERKVEIKKQKTEHRSLSSALRSPASGRRLPSSIFYLLALLLFAFGLMSKPMLVTLPFVLLLLDYWPLQRFQLSTFRLLLWEKLPFFAFSAIISGITYLIQKEEGGVVSITALPITARTGNAVISIARYLGKTFWPVGLAIPYPHPTYWPVTEVILAAILVIGSCILALMFSRRWPFLVTGWFWFLGTLVPVIGLVQVGDQSIADRYTYVPLIGFFIVVVWGAREAFARWQPTRARALASIAAAGLVLLACAARTRDQLHFWRDSGSLFRHSIAVTSQNDLAHELLGSYLISMGKTDEALEHLHEALRINPNNARAYVDVGHAFARQGQWDKAVIHYLEAVRLKPDYGEAHNHLGSAYAQQGKFAKAAAHFQLALQFGAKPAEGRANLGKALAAQGRMEAALGHYREAIRLRSDAPDTLNDLAWILATNPQAKFRNGGEAVALAERAVELTKQKDATKLDTLAAAYAEAGRFSEAVKTAQQALALTEVAIRRQSDTESAGQKELADRIRDRFELYQSRQPYREP